MLSRSSKVLFLEISVFFTLNEDCLYAVSGRLRQSRAMGFTFSVHPESFDQLITTWESNDKFGDPHDLTLSVNGRLLYVGEIRANRIDSFNVLN
ncbi:unnamed protein product [Rotaria magnacalcarata]|uniref:Uncharacterized protein n=1 Tax=Rotaria magnacalcarata TaxID=392030 RepID=A0A8S2PAH3_9BILA|nr:unnamed protein product [Rotaria magnacalcarata]